MKEKRTSTKEEVVNLPEKEVTGSINTSSTCVKCGKPFYNDVRNTVPDLCKCVQKKQAIMGWICPVCGKGLSPYTSGCPCVNIGGGGFNLQHIKTISKDVT